MHISMHVRLQTTEQTGESPRPWSTRSPSAEILFLFLVSRACLIGSSPCKSQHLGAGKTPPEEAVTNGHRFTLRQREIGPPGSDQSRAKRRHAQNTAVSDYPCLRVLAGIHDFGNFLPCVDPDAPLGHGEVKLASVSIPLFKPEKMALSRASQLFSASGLAAAALSFCGGWYCRQTLSGVSRPSPRAPPPRSSFSASSSSSASSLQAPFSQGTREGSRRGPSGGHGLLVTRRIIVPLQEVNEFATFLNALAGYNTQQSGFLSHSIYVHEVVSSASSRDEGNGVVALEILMFEEWADPLAAKAALTCAEIKNSLEQAKKRGWDLRGEVWVGLSGADAHRQEA
ncbi:hypothetical protein TGGT1_224820 [Toxoplasma gondii GT1]|nr:hypothetical protein TGGT1_224820 [Toxoplasma gondii GT1]KAF4640520.1 hypothetical protein TGRH88_044460 [Toxoplasma gondii]